MGKKILCGISNCKHNCNGLCSRKEIFIDKDGKCGLYIEFKTNTRSTELLWNSNSNAC